MDKELLRFNVELVRKALVKYRIAADDVERNAAYGGAMHDGGASRMRAEAIAYEDGLERTIPSFLEPFIKEVNRQEDPDYAKFLELKKKFE